MSSRDLSNAYDPDDSFDKKEDRKSIEKIIQDSQDPNNNDALINQKLYGEATTSVEKRIQDLQNANSDAAQQQAQQQAASDLQQYCEEVEDLLDDDIEAEIAYLEEREALDEKLNQELKQNELNYQQAWANYLAQERQAQQNMLLMEQMAQAQKAHMNYLNELLHQKLLDLRQRYADLKVEYDALKVVYTQAANDVVEKTTNIIDKLDIRDFEFNNSTLSYKDHLKECLKSVFQQLKDNEIKPKDFIAKVDKIMTESPASFIETHKIDDPRHQMLIQEIGQKAHVQVHEQLETLAPQIEAMQITSDGLVAVKEKLDDTQDQIKEASELEDEYAKMLAGSEGSAPDAVVEPTLADQTISREELAENHDKITAAVDILQAPSGSPDLKGKLEKAKEAMEGHKVEIAAQAAHKAELDSQGQDSTKSSRVSISKSR